MDELCCIGVRYLPGSLGEEALHAAVQPAQKGSKEQLHFAHELVGSVLGLEPFCGRLFNMPDPIVNRVQSVSMGDMVPKQNKTTFKEWYCYAKLLHFIFVSYTVFQCGLYGTS